MTLLPLLNTVHYIVIIPVLQKKEIMSDTIFYTK